MKLAIALQVWPNSGIDMETVWEAARLGFTSAEYRAHSSNRPRVTRG
jgi:hypothetical protein